MKQIKTCLKTRITPYLYQQEISRIQRDELLNLAKKTTKIARKESEKTKETERKAKCGNSQGSKEGEMKIQTKPAKSKFKPEDIDWDNLPTLWTDDFYSGE